VQKPWQLDGESREEEGSSCRRNLKRIPNFSMVIQVTSCVGSKLETDLSRHRNKVLRELLDQSTHLLPLDLLREIHGCFYSAFYLYTHYKSLSREHILTNAVCKGSVRALDIHKSGKCELVVWKIRFHVDWPREILTTIKKYRILKMTLSSSICLLFP
jgi:hypothetical protein